MEITKLLVEFVVEKCFDDIPEKTIEVAKDYSLDCLGVMLAGSLDPAGKIITKYVKAAGDGSEAGVVGGHFRTSVLNAALANGTMAHALDYDDFGYFGHPTVTLLPVVLALGEKLRSSGRDILEALVLGYEVYGKIGEACDELYSEGFHPTAIFGTMGATAAAAKLLKLDIESARIAFGIAASLAGGLKQNFGTMTKPLHAGNACRNGITAAMLAKDGFTANHGILEDPLGFGHSFAGEGRYHKENLTKNLGNPFRLISAGPIIKKYPCCGGSHRALDATLELVKEHNISYQQVDRVEVEISPYISQMLIYSEAETGFQGKFSMEYVIAAAILDKNIVLGTFTDEKAHDPKTKEAMRKVKVVVHPEWSPGAIYTSPVTIRLKDDSVYAKQIDNPGGSPEAPLSREELAAKYTDCAQGVLSAEQIKRSMELILNLEQMKDTRELMQIV
ncbi:MmgE/PrpD family protein, partial [Chloroflexota bacterium]